MQMTRWNFGGLAFFPHYFHFSADIWQDPKRKQKLKYQSNFILKHL